jgi:hypothetical protein
MLSEKRHYLARAKARAYRIARLVLFKPSVCCTGTDTSFHSDCLVWAQHNYRNRKRCSCQMCCNPRRRAGRISEQLTMNEKRADVSLQEQVAEAV